MKNWIIMFIVLLGSIISCESFKCDCEYVTYTDGRETYRSSWDASCGDETLSTSTYTNYDGTKSYSKTVIECK